MLVLFPWRHKPWSRQQRPSTTGSQESNTYSYHFLPPRDDLNSPDLYIPVMAFVTYILLSTLLAGLRGAFHPEVMGLTATAAFAIVVIEILGLKFGTYILSISNDSQLLDLVAYSGYKFVGVIVTLVVAEILNRGKGTGGWAGWTVFTYTFLANAFFLVSSSSSMAFANISPPPPTISAATFKAHSPSLNLEHSYDLSNMYSFLTPRHLPRPGVACSQSPGPNATAALSFSSSIRTLCSSYSCGSLAGKTVQYPRLWELRCEETGGVLVCLSSMTNDGFGWMQSACAEITNQCWKSNLDSTALKPLARSVMTRSQN